MAVQRKEKVQAWYKRGHSSLAHIPSGFVKNQRVFQID